MNSDKIKRRKRALLSGEEEKKRATRARCRVWAARFPRIQEGKKKEETYRRMTGYPETGKRLKKKKSRIGAEGKGTSSGICQKGG